jgi:hypothetical protein
MQRDPAEAINQAGRWLASNPQRARAEMAAVLAQLPDAAVAWFNFGLAQHLCGNPEAAIRAYQLSLRCPDPPWREVANNLSQDLLLAGRFAEGWRSYHHRPLQPLPVACEQWYGPSWSGKTPLPSSLLLVSEQGFGDTMMALRFALLLAQRGCRVELVCQRALVELLAHACPAINVRAGLVREAKRRVWAPMLALPGIFAVTADTLADRGGYLHVQADLVRHWRRCLQRRPGQLLVALHWQGKPESERSLYSQGRSFPLSLLALLAGMGGVEFVSIQKGDGSDQWPGPFAAQQVAGQPTVSASSSFLDTAAILANCDLLISSDSAVVHLAGALGVRAWVLLKAIPEWRWGLEGERSYWYDSLRLFRQQSPGQWAEPLQRLRAALAALRPAPDGASPMDSAACPGLQPFGYPS